MLKFVMQSVKHLGLVSWRPTTIKWWQSSQSNRHSTIGTRQTQYHEALPSSANVQSHLTSSFANNGNASWYSVCRVQMVEWWLDSEDCRHLMVIGLHDTGPRYFPWSNRAHSKASECSAWNSSSPYGTSSHSFQKCARKWCYQISLCAADLVTPSHGQDLWNWCKIVIIIINLTYIAQFDTNSILTALCRKHEWHL